MITQEFLVKIRQKELQAEADRNQLLAVAKQNPVQSFSVSARVLTWLGGHLRSWGSQLEDRFAAEAASNQVKSVDRRLNV
jgi:hypothetical protein